jgi:hypothetical protein
LSSGFSYTWPSEILNREFNQSRPITGLPDLPRTADLSIYLHWKSKEALFGTLFPREAVAIWSELLERLREDPQQVLFSNVMRSMMLTGMQRPLARAFFTWDLDPAQVGDRGCDQALAFGFWIELLAQLDHIRQIQVEPGCLWMLDSQAAAFLKR